MARIAEYDSVQASHLCDILARMHNHGLTFEEPRECSNVTRVTPSSVAPEVGHRPGTIGLKGWGHV